MKFVIQSYAELMTNPLSHSIILIVTHSHGVRDWFIYEVRNPLINIPGVSCVQTQHHYLLPHFLWRHSYTDPNTPRLYVRLTSVSSPLFSFLWKYTKIFRSNTPKLQLCPRPYCSIKIFIRGKSPIIHTKRSLNLHSQLLHSHRVYVPIHSVFRYLFEGLVIHVPKIPFCSFLIYSVKRDTSTCILSTYILSGFKHLFGNQSSYSIFGLCFMSFCENR